MKRSISVIALALMFTACSGSNSETTTTDAPVVAAAETITLSISGMDCDGCVKSVTDALKGVAGVQEVEVSLEEHKAVVKGSALDVTLLAAAVDEKGYGAFPYDPNYTPEEGDHDGHEHGDHDHDHHEGEGHEHSHEEGHNH